ncbi:MAG: tripartite tricarboxylate transporter substrate binding protein [Candidimonas sp.]|jgi:tripartite-type tricarboxylate transporter receptor subunit TctC
MKRFKKILSRLVAASFMLLAPHAHAADYPDKPITLVVPFASGGFVHMVALMLSESMGPLLGQTVVVLNQPGANGMLAAGSVARATPDGYTIFLPTASILTINPHLYKNVTLDPIADFTPIGLVVNTSNMYVVHPDSGIDTFSDLIEKAKSAPQAVSYGSSGTGSIQHIAGEALQRQAKLDLLHVPYKGIGPAINDVVGKNLTTVLADASAIPFIQSGRLRAIAVSPSAVDELPGVPTLAEAAEKAGIPGYAAPQLWYGLVAPKGTPEPVIDKLSAALAKALERPDIREKLLAAGAIPATDTSSAFLSGVIRKDYERYGEQIKSLNITID